MPDQVHIDEERRLVEIRSYGVVTKADIAKSIDIICVALETKDIHRVFVDTTQQEKMPTTLEIWELFSQFPKRTRTALLADESQVTADDIAFVETVSQNHGTQMRVFTDRDEAMDWLNQQ